jgi:hypothetical protein
MPLGVGDSGAALLRHGSPPGVQQTGTIEA